VFNLMHWSDFACHHFMRLPRKVHCRYSHVESIETTNENHVAKGIRRCSAG